MHPSQSTAQVHNTPVGWKVPRFAISDSSKSLTRLLRLPPCLPIVEFTSWLVTVRSELQRLVASRCDRRLGSAQPSIRVDPSWIKHHLLHSSTDDSKPELGKRAHLSHGSLTGCPALTRSLPPALSARDSLSKPVFLPLYTPSDFQAQSDLRRYLVPAAHSELSLLDRLRSCRHLTVLQVLP
jgi:hypothetical protein